MKKSFVVKAALVATLLLPSSAVVNASSPEVFATSTEQRIVQVQSAATSQIESNTTISATIEIDNRYHSTSYTVYGEVNHDFTITFYKYISGSYVKQWDYTANLGSDGIYYGGSWACGAGKFKAVVKDLDNQTSQTSYYTVY